MDLFDEALCTCLQVCEVECENISRDFFFFQGDGLGLSDAIYSNSSFGSKNNISESKFANMHISQNVDKTVQNCNQADNTAHFIVQPVETKTRVNEINMRRSGIFELKDQSKVTHSNPPSSSCNYSALLSHISYSNIQLPVNVNLELDKLCCLLDKPPFGDTSIPVTTVIKRNKFSRYIPELSDGVVNFNTESNFTDAMVEHLTTVSEAKNKSPTSELMILNKFPITCSHSLLSFAFSFSHGTSFLTFDKLINDC